jgi:predicted lipoprotein with Yx(FWY)xxD motif
MIRSRPITFLASAAVIPLTALAVAACGSGGAATASPPPSKTATAAPKAATAATKAATVRVANSRLGRILVDSRGRTLYLFKADVGAKSACLGACATAWPPLRSGGKPAVRSGARAALVGTTKRSDGARQVTYNGHPLYLFIKDHKPGDVTGEGVSAFGAAWFAVSPAGKQISSKPSGHGRVSLRSHAAAPAAPPAAKPQPARKPLPRPAPKSTPQPAPPVAKPQPAPKPLPQPAPQSTPSPAPPVVQPTPPPSNGIPQNNGGDGDSDNNGGPSDGDGNV